MTQLFAELLKLNPSSSYSAEAFPMKASDYTLRWITSGFADDA